MESISPAVLRTLALGDPLARVRGFLKPVLVASGANASLTLYSVPGDEIARIQSVRCAVVTSAAVQNRTPVLQIQDADSNVIIESGPGVNLTASLTWQLNAFPEAGTPLNLLGNRLIFPIPDLFLYPGYKLVLLNVGNDAADVIGPARLLVTHLDLGGLGYDLGRVLDTSERR